MQLLPVHRRRGAQSGTFRWETRIEMVINLIYLVQVLHYMQGNRMRMLVLGESLIRQLHTFICFTTLW